MSFLLLYEQHPGEFVDALSDIRFVKYSFLCIDWFAGLLVYSFSLYSCMYVAFSIAMFITIIIVRLIEDVEHPGPAFLFVF